MHICVGNLTIIGSDNGLSPGRRQAIIWTNAGILSIGNLGTDFSEILIEIITFSFKKMHLKVSSAKGRSCCMSRPQCVSEWKPWTHIKAPPPPPPPGPPYPCPYSHRWAMGCLLWKLSWWLHQMEHFPRNWPFVRGIHRSQVNSPHKGQWRGALMFSLICVWILDWVNNREAGDLRRYHAHFDVIVMLKTWNQNRKL